MPQHLRQQIGHRDADHEKNGQSEIHLIIMDWLDTKKTGRNYTRPKLDVKSIGRAQQLSFDYGSGKDTGTGL
jgi:hypothetical protein